MKAVRNTDEGVAVVEVPPPDPTASAEGIADGIADGIVVQPVSVGICGSDLHVIAMGRQGMTLGHEIGALFEGRPVAIQPMAFCGACVACQRGDTHVCEVGNRGVYGMHLNGGMAEELLVDRQCLVELPPGLDAGAACLVEPMAVGVHTVNKADLEPGMRVAVIGAGTVGLVAGAVARTKGVDVDIVHRHAPQAAAAERLGLRPVLGDDLGRGYDVVIDGAGTESSLAAAIRAVRPAGTIVVPGIYWGDITVPGMALCLKEVQLRVALYYGHHHGERETDTAAAVLAELPELGPALVSHRFELGNAPAAFATAADRAAGAIKVVVDIA